jgi:hypothetical protein
MDASGRSSDFAWWFAGKGRSLISGLLVQAVSLLALMEFADEVLI